MATDIVGSLFGVTPEALETTRQQQMRQQALALAQLTPQEQITYGASLAGQQFGRGVGGVLGAEDPQMKKVSTLNALGRQFDMTSPEGLLKASQSIQSIYPDVAIVLASKGNELKLAQLKTQKEELSIDQEKNLRKELADLGPYATNSQILAAVVKYGSPDKVLAALQLSADKEAQRQNAKELQDERLKSQEQMLKDRLDAQLEAAKERGATQLQIAQIQAEGRKAIADMTASFRQQAIDDKKAKENEQKAGVISSFDSAIDTLDTLAKHPGKSSAVGMTGKIMSAIPGTNASGFASQLETFKSQVFLPQVQSLKGMGALSDAEGKKLTASIGALDQNMTPAEFDAQLAKIKNSLTQARSRVSASMPNQPGMLNSVDKQALDWANANPNDPRSAEIKKRLGR